MGQLSGTLDIMYVEDDGEDFSLFLDAVRENGFLFNTQRVNDGQELVDFFRNNLALTQNYNFRFKHAKEKRSRSCARDS